ncbi:hypothetical protein Dalk_4576 [Desulfatibacillum aliphaticivorans]|uniref:Uncharacterized protein n=1 Tax=Desulfatibacillum aliphaticivorans TaxID=218208 RepID=B8FNH3_DESAL|nr:hypothetical protein [Desulfatibacillum aliphaticivorans]ACL06254.1 hypothetical protein Dalk_4576 [Desulfatibacillum aliphaticivorans]
MKMDQAIYKQGDTGVITIIRNGRCIFSGSTADDIISKNGPGCSLMPFDVAYELAEQAMEARFIGDWEEIDSDQWYEALYMLPPDRWETVSGVEFFQVSERLCGAITSTYARASGRYFTANRKINANYGELADEVRKVL